jgi:predicted esterase
VKPSIAALFASLGCAGALAAPAWSASPNWHDFQARVQSARTTLVAHYDQIQQRSRLAATLEERLDTATGQFNPGSKPSWVSDAVFLQYALAVAGLNGALIDQLASGRPHPLGSVRGADDIPIHSIADGTQQPLAVYVPAGYESHTAAPLVVMLHGYTQTEADEIASPWIRSAADSSGAIVAAPYARGDAHYTGLAPQDIYQTVTVMKHAFNIDPQRVYLAGHSMGGFGIFTIAPLHPQVWAAFLCVSGSLTEEDKNTALQSLRASGKPVYMVQGSDDQVVPALYARRTAHWLQSAGIGVRYYEQPGGMHSLGTMAPAFSRAWRDMLAGVKTPTVIPAEDASPAASTGP